jgi:hypothetical protein
MPRKAPRNVDRSYKDRTSGLFKKGTELHKLDGRTTVHIIIEREGMVPQLFTSGEEGTGACVNADWVSF